MVGHDNLKQWGTMLEIQRFGKVKKIIKMNQFRKMKIIFTNDFIRFKTTNYFILFKTPQLRDHVLCM